MASVRDLNAAQIAYHERELRQIDERTTSLRQDLDDAQAVLERAQHAVDTLKRSLHGMENRRKCVSSASRDLRAYVNPEIIRSFPVELIREIFFALDSNLREDPRDYTWLSFYSRNGEILPFTFAAVCQRWRQMALESPSCWSYVTLGVPTDVDGFPNLEECGHAQRYVDIVLTLLSTRPPRHLCGLAVHGRGR